MRTAHHHRVPDAGGGHVIDKRATAYQQIRILDPFDAGSAKSRSGQVIIPLSHNFLLRGTLPCAGVPKNLLWRIFGVASGGCSAWIRRGSASLARGGPPRRTSTRRPDWRGD